MNEYPPQAPKTPEGNQEKVHSKQEVLAAMLPYIQNAAGIEDVESAVDQERGNEHGLYLLTVRKPGEKPGETIEYAYTRVGNHSKDASAAMSRIDIVYYNADGIPEGGNDLATYDEEAGEWKTT